MSDTRLRCRGPSWRPGLHPGLSRGRTLGQVQGPEGCVPPAPERKGRPRQSAAPDRQRPRSDRDPDELHRPVTGPEGHHFRRGDDGVQGVQRVKVLLDEMLPIGMRELLPSHEVYSASPLGIPHWARTWRTPPTWSAWGSSTRGCAGV